MWALIVDGAVAETTDTDPMGRFHPDLVWVPCGAEVRAGWRHDETGFAPPAEPGAAPPAVPDLVSMRQGRLAMLAAGLLDRAEAAVAALNGEVGRAARIEWEYAATLRRHHPLVAQLGEALGLDGEALNALFVAAAAIPE